MPGIKYSNYHNYDFTHSTNIYWELSMSVTVQVHQEVLSTLYWSLITMKLIDTTANWKHKWQLQWTWEMCNHRTVTSRIALIFVVGITTFIKGYWSTTFVVVELLRPTLCDSMDCSTWGYPFLHHLLEFAQTLVHWVNDAIQPSCPLSPPSPPAFNLSHHQGLFQWVSSSHQVAKVLELQQQSFQWIFRDDFL